MPLDFSHYQRKVKMLLSGDYKMTNTSAGQCLWRTGVNCGGGYPAYGAFPYWEIEWLKQDGIIEDAGTGWYRVNHLGMLAKELDAMFKEYRNANPC